MIIGEKPVLWNNPPSRAYLLRMNATAKGIRKFYFRKNKNILKQNFRNPKNAWPKRGGASADSTITGGYHVYC